MDPPPPIPLPFIPILPKKILGLDFFFQFEYDFMLWIRQKKSLRREKNIFKKKEIAS
jgi:hypothetical protein